MSARLAAIRIAAPEAAWEAAGFAVDDQGRVPLSNGAVELSGDRVAALVVDGVAGVPGDIEGIPLVPGEVVGGSEHPNGAFELDHVVVLTDSLDRTSAAVTEALGIERRRIREAGDVRQAFHRFADQGGSRGCIVEIVERGDIPRTGLWGLVVNVADLDAAVDRLGPDVVGAPKDAVQPGRRIATVRRDAALGLPVALMSP